MDLQFASILVFAIVVAIIASIIACIGYNNDKKIKTKYDERQKQARGKSFMLGFYTMAGASAVFMILHLLGLGHFMGIHGYATTVILGVIVQMSYAIFKDAYVGINTNLRKYLIFMTAVSLINIFAAVTAFVSGTMIIDGALQTPFLNLLCSVLFAVLVADLGIKKLIDKKEQ
jgi:hypothetical protein